MAIPTDANYWALQAALQAARQPSGQNGAAKTGFTLPTGPQSMGLGQGGPVQGVVPWGAGPSGQATGMGLTPFWGHPSAGPMNPSHPVPMMPIAPAGQQQLGMGMSQPAPPPMAQPTAQSAPPWWGNMSLQQFLGMPVNLSSFSR